MTRAIRWSDDDRYFGPFTYAKGRSSRFSVELGSGDDDDYPGCRLRLSVGHHTLIVALPPIIQPQRRKVSAKWDEATVKRLGRDWYYDTHEREYGFSFIDGALHVHYGAQTMEWPGSKSKVFFYPWREHRCIRHSLYDLEGEHFADLPEWGFGHKNGWAVRNAIEAACPAVKFEFADYDGERIIATTRIEEREWKRGKGLFRLFFLGRNRIGRSLDLSFSSEVGKRKGSWKGGTVGHSIDMLSGELHEATFRRYCQQEGLTFLAIAIDAAEPLRREAGSTRKGESAGLEEASPERQSDTQTPAPKE